MSNKGYMMLEAKILSQKGEKQANLAEKFGVTDRTIRNWLRREGINPIPRKKKRKKLDPFLDGIHAKIEDNPDLNCEILFEELVVQGYKGGISRLRDEIRPIRKVVKNRIALAFETSPGRQAQVDWKECGKFQLLDGRDTKIFAFVMILGYSRKAFVQLVTNMRSSTLLACHLAAFRYFGGVPAEILYDNMKTAFLCHGGSWQVNPRLLAFAADCGFFPRRCKTYCPWTKGKVERFNGFLGKNLLPRLSRDGVDIDQLNSDVLKWVERVVDVRKMAAFGLSRNERFLQEKSFLSPLGQGIDCSERLPAIVRNDATVQYRNSRYTVPPEHVGRTTELRIDPLAARIAIYHGATLLREHGLAPEGLRQRVEHPDDVVALRTLWEHQERVRTQRLSRRLRKAKSKAPQREVPDVRSPGLYDTLIGEAA